MLRAAKCLLLVAVLFVSADVLAASGPQYTAKLKLGKGNSTTGGSLMINGKGIDLISLWGLQTTATAKGVLATSSPELGVFTSNGNKRVTFYSNGAGNVISTNGNLLKVAYTVKVDKNGNVTCKSDKSISKGGGNVNITGIQFQAKSGKGTTTFKFTFSGPQVDAAVALLPTGGKKNLPTLAGCTDFTLQIGSATFVTQPDSKGKVKF